MSDTYAQKGGDHNIERFGQNSTVFRQMYFPSDGKPLGLFAQNKRFNELIKSLGFVPRNRFVYRLSKNEYFFGFDVFYGIVGKIVRQSDINTSSNLKVSDTENLLNNKTIEDFIGKQIKRNRLLIPCRGKTLINPLICNFSGREPYSTLWVPTVPVVHWVAPVCHPFRENIKKQLNQELIQRLSYTLSKTWSK